MKKTFKVRKIDNLGRIVIPMDIRKSLEISDWDELCIRQEGQQILISKAREACAFCGSEENLVPFHEKSICRACLGELKQK